MHVAHELPRYLSVIYCRRDPACLHPNHMAQPDGPDEGDSVVGTLFNWAFEFTGSRYASSLVIMVRACLPGIHPQPDPTHLLSTWKAGCTVACDPPRAAHSVAHTHLPPTLRACNVCLPGLYDALSAVVGAAPAKLRLWPDPGAIRAHVAVSYTHLTLPTKRIV